MDKRKSVLYKVAVRNDRYLLWEFETWAVSLKHAENNVRHRLVGELGAHTCQLSFVARLVVEPIALLPSRPRQEMLPGIKQSRNAQLL